MIIRTANEWESCDKSGLVSVGSYSLYVSTAGPPRRPGAPVIIFITGGGAPTELYVHLHRAVSKFTRNYFFDRAGYGRSERPSIDPNKDTGNGVLAVARDPAEISKRHTYESQPWWLANGVRGVFDIVTDREGLQGTRFSTSESIGRSNKNRDRKIWAEDSASELHRLMRAIAVAPPYVLAAHSYGGIIARTYYDMFPDDVAGMALLDTNSELLQQCLGPIPPLAFQSVVADVDPEQVFHLREASAMSEAEWKAAMAAIARTRWASADEETHGSGRELARRRQIDHQVMGRKPLLVMRSDMARDFRLLFEAGQKLGGGTEQERREADWWVESAELYCAQIQRVQLELSKKTEYVAFEDMGHDFPIRAPERTAEVIRRLFNLTLQHQHQRQQAGL